MTFIKNYQLKKEYCGEKRRTSASRLNGHKSLRFNKCHKRVGASSGLWNKQFDTSRREYCKYFLSRTSVPDISFETYHVVWCFGKGVGRKFCYSF